MIASFAGGSQLEAGEGFRSEWIALGCSSMHVHADRDQVPQDPIHSLKANASFG